MATFNINNIQFDAAFGKMGKFDVCELAPGLLVESNKNWQLRPELFAMLCYPGDTQEMVDVWQKHLKEVENKSSEG